MILMNGGVRVGTRVEIRASVITRAYVNVGGEGKSRSHLLLALTSAIPHSWTQPVSQTNRRTVYIGYCPVPVAGQALPY